MCFAEAGYWPASAVVRVMNVVSRKRSLAGVVNVVIGVSCFSFKGLVVSREKWTTCLVYLQI